MTSAYGQINENQCVKITKDIKRQCLKISEQRGSDCEREKVEKQE